MCIVRSVRVYLFATVLAALTVPCLPVSAAEVVAPTRDLPVMLAQQDPNNTSSNRSSSRSTRGMVKLGIFVIGGVIVAGGWIINKIRGGGDD